MLGIDWGGFCNRYHDTPVDRDAVEREIKRLIDNEDVTKHQGIFEYILTRDERNLNIRAFPKAVKQRAYECTRASESSVTRNSSFDGGSGSHYAMARRTENRGG